MQRRSVAAQSDQDLSFHKDVSETVSSDPDSMNLEFRISSEFLLTNRVTLDLKYNSGMLWERKNKVIS